MVLTWRQPTKDMEIAHTRCEIVSSEHIPCELALAVDGCKQDAEDIEEIDKEEHDNELVVDSRPNNLGLLRPASKDYCI